MIHGYFVKALLIIKHRASGVLLSYFAPLGVIASLLTELNRMGKTILVVTHDKDIAAFCNRTIHIVDGKIEMEAHQRTFKL